LIKLVAEPRVFTLPLQDLLWEQIDRCRKRDVKFRTPHVLLALFKVPSSFARACCNRIQGEFSQDLIEHLEKFVEQQPENPEEVGYVPVELSKYPLAVVARNDARAERREIADERDLFLAFLRSEAGTNRWIRKRLGKVKFKKLLEQASLPSGVTKI
jgi:hypothetical protein